MAFREIQKGVQRRLSVLHKESSFSQQVIRVISAIYPRAKQSIVRIVYEPKRRRIRIYTSNPSAMNKFTSDRTVIHAALRREGIDVRELVVR